MSSGHSIGLLVHFCADFNRMLSKYTVSYRIVINGEMPLTCVDTRDGMRKMDHIDIDSLWQHARDTSRTYKFEVVNRDEQDNFPSFTNDLLESLQEWVERTLPSTDEMANSGKTMRVTFVKNTTGEMRTIEFTDVLNERLGLVTVRLSDDSVRSFYRHSVRKFEVKG